MLKSLACCLVMLGLQMAPSWAAPGVSADRILIGQAAGITGAVAGSVQDQIAGAQICFKAINDKGGLFGRRIELRTRDDGFDPKRTPEAVGKLLREDGVLALFMVRGTGNNESILPLIEKDGVPLIAPASGAIRFHQPAQRLIFNVRAPYQMEVAAAVRHLTTLNVAALAMIYVDDAFGADVVGGFKKALAESGLKPALIQAYKRPVRHMGKEVGSFIQAAPGAIFVIGSAAEAADFIRQYRAAGGGSYLVTLSNNASQAFRDALAADGRGVIITQVVPDSARAGMAVAQEYRRLAKAQGQSVNDAGMEGFMSAKVLIEGLRRAGSKLTRERLLSALESMHEYDLGGITIGYSPTDHTGSQFVETSIIAASQRLIR